MTHEVFISYSSRDKNIADMACAIFEQRGIRCWIAPRDILSGMEWAESIVDAINQTKIMALLFSVYSDSSPQVLREVNHAISRGVIILPIRIEDVTPTGSMEYFISVCHWLDALTPPLENELLKASEIIEKILLNPNSIRDLSEQFIKPTLISSQLKAARFIQKWQICGIRSSEFESTLSGAEEIHLVNNNALIYYEMDKNVESLSVLSAENGDYLFCLQLPPPFRLEDFALTNSTLYLRGSVQTTPYDVSWIQKVDYTTKVKVDIRGKPTFSSTFEKGEIKSGRTEHFSPENALHMTVKEYNDLPWRDYRTMIGRPLNENLTLDAQLLKYSNSNFLATWKSPTKSVIKASTLVNKRLLVLTKDERIYCLELKEGNGLPKGTSNGRWYNSLVHGGDGRDLQVQCINCMYTEWYEPRQGKNPPMNCPCCGF